MAVPQPPSELEGHCSAIYNDTLYVLSPDSFLSLPLKKHAQWSQHPMGVPVTGPACVQAGDGADAALYVIGGKTSKSNYPGMQRFNFAQRSWETLPPWVDVLSGRTEHSVAYLADTQQILVYAGSQPNAYSFLSSQTFLVGTSEPYDVLAFTSEAPPGNMPILAAWDGSHAVMLGGSDWNIEIFTFSLADGWQQVQTNLTAPINPSSRATIINGSDGSKVLELYDMHVSPNSVQQIVLLGAGGSTAYTGEMVGSPGKGSRKRKRDLTLNNWPRYNDRNAPSAIRTDCAVAQSPNGVAVISGGSTSDPVAIFNQDDNSWVDAGKFFAGKKEQQPLKPTHTTSTSSTKSTPTPTKSSTPSSTTTPAVASGGGDDAHQRMLRTLGITLGVLCGIAAIFILVLLFLRWRKLKRRRQEGYLDEKNDGTRMSFADRGASFMKEAGGSINGLAPPNNKAWNSDSNNGSHSSLAIITGKFSNKRNTSGHEPKPSYDSQTPIIRDKHGTPIISEPMEMVDLDDKKRGNNFERKPVPRREPRPPSAPYGPNLTAADAHRRSTDSERRNRSSGWSKYFATSQPTGPNGLSHLPSAYVQTNKLSDASMYSTDRNVSQPSQIPSSALVPPLDIDFDKTLDGQRLSHVTSGSPAFNDSREDLAARGQISSGAFFSPPEAQSGRIVDPTRRSASDTISSYNRSTMSTTTSEFYAYNNGSSGGAHDGNAAVPWTPTSTSFKDHLVSSSRAPSSVYPTDRDSALTNSEPRVPSRGKGGGGGFFPGSGASYRPPPKAKSTTSPANGPAVPAPVLTASASNTKVLLPPALNLGAGRRAVPESRDSNVTVFPKGVPSAYYAGRNGESVPAAGEPERGSTLTLFPRGVGSGYYPSQTGQGKEEAGKPVNSDLGWLNLGLGGGQSRI